MTTDVGFCVDELTLEEFFVIFNLFVWKYNVASECFSHKQIFAKRSRSSS